jgi:hypothetical protein
MPRWSCRCWALDSRERGLSAWLMAPVLFPVLMVGPLGLLVYLVLRGLTMRRRGAGVPPGVGS